MAVEGNLKDMSLTSLVQIICLEQRKAALFLRRPGEEGVIFFDDGEIIHAIVGALVGEEAVYQLLSWADGNFRISDHVTIPRRTVTVPWSNLLLQGLYQLDEQRAEDAAQTQVLSVAEIEQDSALENELIFLLSRLENLRAQLADKKSRKRPTLALQIMTEIVNHLVEFSEGYLNAETDADSLKKALVGASDKYPSARLLQVQNNRLSGQAVSNLYSAWGSDSAGRRQTFHQVGQSMIDMLETYFLLLIARFRSSSMIDQWRETYRVFLADLTQAIDKIKF